MKKFTIFTAIVCFMLAVNVVGCAQKKAQNSQEAIAQSKELKTVDEQVHYLVGQANAFINGKEFNEAIATAQHILANVDQNSAEAKSVLEKAKAELQKAAQATMDDVKNKIGNMGK